MDKETKREYDRKRYRSKPDYFKKNSTAWRESNREWFMWSSARSRAKTKNLPFDIAKEDLVFPEFCPILGIKLSHAHGSYANKDNSPSIDRKIPELGYTKENTWIISNKANTMKNNASPEELKKFAEWVMKTYE